MIASNNNTSTISKQRARTDEEKALRKQSIVDSLKHLLSQSDELPSTMQIAKQAGVTKSVIYQYFNSREEIFLLLLLQSTEPLKILTQIEFTNIIEIRDRINQFFIENPLFMKLSIMSPVNLEENVDQEFVKLYKMTAARIMEKLADIIIPFCNADETQRRLFINSYYQLSLMKWQNCHPSQNVKDAFQDEQLWLIGYDLKADLNMAFDWLYNGMVNSSK